MKCEQCNSEFKPLNPPVEDYVNHKFCLNIFGFKLMLIKDEIEYGCSECMAQEQADNEYEYLDGIVAQAIDEEISKGNLIPKNERW